MKCGALYIVLNRGQGLQEIRREIKWLHGVPVLV